MSSQVIKVHIMNDLLKSKIDTLMGFVPKNKYGHDINTDIIHAGEQKYRLQLPIFYKWFIEKYKYIYLWGEMTKSVVAEEYQDDCYEDIFYFYHLNINENSDYNHKLVFLETEELEEFYFPIENNQVKEQVFLKTMYDEDELYADNFLEFLLIEIPKNYHRFINQSAPIHQ